MSYQDNTFVHGQQPSANQWNVLATNDAHFYSFLGDNEAWTSFTPTITNLSGANNTITGAYQRIGNIVSVSVKIVLGASFSFGGTITVAPPFTATQAYSNQARGGSGFVRVLDANGSNYFGEGRFETTTSWLPAIMNTSAANYAANSGITGTVPITFAVPDELHFLFHYEAVSA